VAPDIALLSPALGAPLGGDRCEAHSELGSDGEIQGSVGSPRRHYAQLGSRDGVQREDGVEPCTRAVEGTMSAGPSLLAASQGWDQRGRSHRWFERWWEPRSVFPKVSVSLPPRPLLSQLNLQGC
jgi:hypothetical protein